MKIESDSFQKLANPGISELVFYEPGKPIDEVARELGLGDADEIIKLASNENALGASPLALEALRKFACNVHLYPDGSAYHLKNRLAEKLNLHPENLIIGNGSNEIIEFIGHVFMAPGTNIVMADRAFVVYKLVAAMFGAEALTVPMVEYRHDLDAMLKAVTPETRVIFIANPNNPTGTRVSNDDIEGFMERVPDDVIICFDEAYVELLPAHEQPPTLDYVRDGRNVIVLRTFSKTYGLAGLRVGYAAAPPECINLLNRVRQPFNVNAAALAAAQAALDDYAHVEATRKMVQDGLKQFYAAFDEMGLSYIPSSANFVLVKTGSGRERFHTLQKMGVIVRPMDGYGLPDYIRITVGTESENRRCIESLANIIADSAK
jgi:histidinol-phosphate aminotransferase